MQIRPLSTTLLRLSSAVNMSSPLSIFYVRFSSAVSFNHSSQSRRSHHDEESRNVRVSVWWDFENCNLPAGVNAFKVAQAITAAIRNSSIKGPITITAFGDVLQLSRTKQEALSSSGINLTHVPNGGKNSADRSLLVDLMFWVSQNPPPAHLFLISGDRDFAGILHRLRMNNYNILLASKDTVPSVLCSSASIMWDWFGLIKGENVTGKYFNQPPDGPYGSWYGHYKGPLADPFATAEQSTVVKTEELSANHPNPDSKSRPVLKAVIKQIHEILSLHPKGISIGELRAELSKSDIVVDKDFYGYKKFSRFLVSISDLLKVQFGPDGQFLVYGTKLKAPEPFDSGVSLSNGSDQRFEDQEKGASVTMNVNSDIKTANRALEARTEEPIKAQQNIPDNKKTVKQEAKKPEKIVEEPIPAGELGVKVTNEPVRMDQLAPITEHDSAGEDGFLKKLKRLWLGPFETKTACLPEHNSVSEDGTMSRTPNASKLGNESGSIPEMKRVVEKHAKSSSSSSIELAKEVNVSAEEGENKSETTGLFDRVVKWLKSWRKNTTAIDTSDQANGNQELIDEIFSKGSFWIDIESFVNSLRGSFLISQSKTREEMARNLQKEGPSCLKPLAEATILHLVSLLISDKKWVEECPSEALPFRVTRVYEMDYGSGHSRAANGLRSIFLEAKSQSTELEAEKKPQIISHTRVDKKPLERSRKEVIADCQKLVKEVLKEHPEGYNMGCFRKDFLERYGYRLEIQKLGYEKLQSLIQIMPGVRIESGYIVPLSTVPDDLDSPFEELGPVSEKKIEMQSKWSYDYEPSLSEDEESDSEAEASGDHLANGKKNANEEDSSLLQILDSWYSSKEGDDKEKKTDGLIDSPVDISGSKPSRGYGRKPRPAKSYSFVSDSVENNQDKLVDGILGSLKKSNESRLQGRSF